MHFLLCTGSQVVEMLTDPLVLKFALRHRLRTLFVGRNVPCFVHSGLPESVHKSVKVFINEANLGPALAQCHQFRICLASCTILPARLSLQAVVPSVVSLFPGDFPRTERAGTRSCGRHSQPGIGPPIFMTWAPIRWWAAAPFFSPVDRLPHAGGVATVAYGTGYRVRQGSV